jgi:hypothetical protein
VQIVPLPAGYRLATGEFTTTRDSDRIPLVRVTSWLPDAYGTCTFEDGNRSDSEIEDAFIERNCHHCDYFFDAKNGELDNLDLEDADGNYIVSCTVTSQCPAYNGGLEDIGWPCCAGHDDPFRNRAVASTDDGEMWLPAMAWAQDLSLRTLYPGPIRAWAQKIDQANDGRWLMSDRWQAMNIYGDERVCWGDASVPDSLPLAVETYCDAYSNDDLLTFKEFVHNVNQLKRSCCVHAIPGQQIQAGYDAVLVASAAATPTAFLLLRASGVPSPEHGLIFVGLRVHQHQLDDGTVIDAYITDPVVGDRCWLVINNLEQLDDSYLVSGRGLLLGQIPHPIASAPCLSPAPSSSELAAPAVS